MTLFWNLSATHLNMFQWKEMEILLKQPATKEKEDMGLVIFCQQWITTLMLMQWRVD